MMSLSFFGVTPRVILCFLKTDVISFSLELYSIGSLLLIRIRALLLLVRVFLLRRLFLFHPAKLLF